MLAILKFYLLLTCLLHLAFGARCDSGTEAEIPSEIEAIVGAPYKEDQFIDKPSNAYPKLSLANSADSLPDVHPSKRTGRQFYLDPNLYFIPAFGLEGSRCVTGRGLQGLCVRIDQCKQFYRVRRQVQFYSFRNWANSLGAVDNSICTFLDTFGRANSGICCANDVGNGNGVNYIPVLIPKPVPLPAPPADNPVTTTDTPATDVIDKSDERETEVINAPEENRDNDGKADNPNDFVVENHVEDVENVPAPQPYDDMRYQWSTQFGSFGAQWPPAAPTHPPGVIGSWPPPIPTHPPDHHYPTHPASTAETKPTVPSTALTTRRAPTTTRRPSYPNYPGYPSYRPTFSPITTKRPTVAATTMRPSNTGTSSGTSSNGLPLQCGIKNPTSPDQERIVGGTNASPYEFPWIAVLFKSGKQFCGGSLITKEHILTAAHCVARMTSWDVAALTVHLGDYNIRTDFEVKHVTRRIKRLVRHKGFDFSTLHNDVAVLTLSEPVKFTQEIQPICLPTSAAQISRSYSGQTATVAGWGSLRENGPQPSILQKVDIPIWTNSECARKYGHAAPAGIIESMICAGQASKDSCSGDSGGPLIVNDGGRYTQIGIVSWGIGCGKGQYPGVYTRVTSLLPWIYKNIK